jgi:hypothetical protein
MIIAKRGQKLKQRFGLAEILTNLCASQRRNCAPGSLTTVPFRPGLFDLSVKTTVPFSPGLFDLVVASCSSIPHFAWSLF